MSAGGNEVRLRVSIRGAVQGVGFRPFVYRLATELGLRGHVVNTGDGVRIEAEGPKPVLDEFLSRLRTSPPPRSRVSSLESTWLEPAGLGEFRILGSSGGPKRTLVLPDIATCAECEADISDPANRRYFYPFTNCVNCGPRFSIIEALPYDRPNTSMRRFDMCPLCRAEYANPGDRRFHAQPNACPACGPHLELWDAQGNHMGGRQGADAESTRELLRRAAEVVVSGHVLALKGLGGFHLVVDATNDSAVELLRARKRREEKPFAVMFSSLEQVRQHCSISAQEEALLEGPERPIVLVAKRAEAAIAAQAAPRNPSLGAMLPYTPLHLLFLKILGRPIIATSGNLSDEPICIDEHEALERLAGIADVFLIHNRPILRHVDDSVLRIAAGREMILRRARGYAPLPVSLNQAPACGPILAVGAHLKNTVALSIGPDVFISQHIGDLETDAAFRAFERSAADLPRLYETQPALVAADAHPDYLSSRFARDQSAPQVMVQHHVAHALSCMTENELEPPVMGVSWDGTGFGPDGTVWGGEFFEVTDASCRRIAKLRPFRLPGGEAAVKEPRRAAAGLLFEIFGDKFSTGETLAKGSFSREELMLIEQMLAKGLNVPVTSSMGRLFDAVASLAGVRQVTRHEGQAAMELEFAAAAEVCSESYPAPVVEQAGMAVLDWEPMIRCILEDVRQRTPLPRISAAFHNTLAQWITAIAARVGYERVVLSGGCFQNIRLLETTITELKRRGFRPFWHQRVPPNDGGISLGQVIAAARFPYLLADGSQSAENPAAARPVSPN